MFLKSISNKNMPSALQNVMTKKACKNGPGAYARAPRESLYMIYLADPMLTSFDFQNRIHVEGSTTHLSLRMGQHWKYRKRRLLWSEWISHPRRGSKSKRACRLQCPWSRSLHVTCRCPFLCPWFSSPDPCPMSLVPRDMARLHRVATSSKRPHPLREEGRTDDEK